MCHLLGARVRRGDTVRNLTLLLALVAAATLASLCAGTAAADSLRSLCGTERWSVKTLQDRPTLLPTRTTTVKYLTSLPAPADLPYTRLPFERHVFRVTAAVTLVRPEDDGDYHLVLSAGGAHMIAEAPMPGCTVGATPIVRREMTTARRAVRLCHHAVVTGVAFFDFKHGQTGVAPNAIELHPILGFRCLRG